MTADYLDSEAESEYQRGKRLVKEVEDRERELVNLRDHRDEAFRRAAEMRAAANILREVGLRSETTPSGPLIMVNKQV